MTVLPLPGMALLPHAQATPTARPLLGLDPGTERSAWVLWDGARVLAHACEANGDVLGRVVANLFGGMPADRLSCEMVASYGMPVGREVFETVLWIGRFVQAWEAEAKGSGPVQLVYRRDVKMHLCGNMRAKDPNVRQALLDRVGPPGTKRAPGPTYGLHGDEWSALAVAVTAWELA